MHLHTTSAADALQVRAEVHNASDVRTLKLQVYVVFKAGEQKADQEVTVSGTGTGEDEYGQDGGCHAAGLPCCQGAAWRVRDWRFGGQ